MNAAGLFGKLASQGDFVTRRLPPAFVATWDAWLQAGMREARTRCGESWLDLYLHAPVWRFALAPGVCGVLLPSVDRVGRHFPLTLVLVQDAPLAPSVFDLAARGAAWFDALTDLAVRAMWGELSVADLDVALEALGTPQCHAVTDDDWVPLASGLDACAALARVLGPAGVDGKALFWTEGSATMAPALFVSDGLPSPHAFGAMLGAAR